MLDIIFTHNTGISSESAFCKLSHFDLRYCNKKHTYSYIINYRYHGHYLIDDNTEPPIIIPLTQVTVQLIDTVMI